MLTRSQKEEAVKKLEGEFAETNGLLFGNYRGLKVKDINDLRAKLKKAGSRLQVVRKTLLARALAGSHVTRKQIDELPGQVAVALVSSDPIAAAKVFTVFQKEHESLELTGGFVGGRLLARGEALALAKLPGFEELRAQVVYTLAAPLTGLVRALNWPAQSFVRTLAAIKKQ